MEKKQIKLELTPEELLTLKSALAVLHKQLEEAFGKAVLDKNREGMELFSASVDNIVNIHNQIQNGVGIVGGMRGKVKRVLKWILSRM